MNVLPKGTFTVIMATVIASSLILFSGNTVADSAEKTSGEISSAASKEVGAITNGAEVAAKLSELKKTKLQEKAKVTPLPPPGPFFIEGVQGKELDVGNLGMKNINPNRKESTPTLAKKPLLPSFDRKEPVFEIEQPKSREIPINENRQPEQTTKLLEPEFKRMQPSLSAVSVTTPEIGVVAPKLAKKTTIPVLDNLKLNKPVLQKSEPTEPSFSEKMLGAPVINQVATRSTAREPVPPSRIDANLTLPKLEKEKAPSEPIWMQKLPIRPALQSNRTMRKYRAGNNSTPTWQNNTGLVPPMNQQYIYIPMPAYRSGYSYPPMPMNNNSGYYTYGPNYKIPAGVLGGSQNTILDSRILNNTEIK